MRPTRGPFSLAILTWLGPPSTETRGEDDCDNGEADFLKQDGGPSGCPADPESVGAIALFRTAEEMSVPDRWLRTAVPRHHQFLEPYRRPLPEFAGCAGKRIAVDADRRDRR